MRIRFIFFFMLMAAMNPSYGQQTISQLRETALTFQRQGDHANALLVFSRALQQDPKIIQLLTDVAYTYYLQRDFGKGMEAIRPLVEREDAEVRTFQVAGNIYKAIEEVGACDRMYRRALKKFPESGVLYSEHGELLMARKDLGGALALWEKGIQVDPGHSGNYYHASRFYHFNGERTRSMIYGEIFLNMDSYSARSAEVKSQLLESYKNFFIPNDNARGTLVKKRSGFEEAFRIGMERQRDMASMGIDVYKLIMIRTRFILDWYAGSGKEYPHRLFEQHQYLLREGMFEAYNQWLFGATSNILEYQHWVNTHADDLGQFTYYQRNRIFKMPPGQYYGVGN